ncbi:Mitochondrial import inner membrane translocase subunit tim-16, partial [Termitomyces sp. J132]
SSPKVLVQILITGTRILGKAFYEAGRQAVKNAKHQPQGVTGGDAAGVGAAMSSSPTDQLTRQYRMTLDEANLILNVKREESLEQILKNYEHLFKTNSPPPPPEKPMRGKASQPTHSHYLQSKVFRARERIEAERKLQEPSAPPADAQTSPPPSEVPGGGKS